MGQHHSTLEAGILAALGNDASLMASTRSPLYFVDDIHPYNLEFDHIVPVGVVYPRTVEQVAAVIRCAAEAGVKVQARGGGHSFGDHCK